MTITEPTTPSPGAERLANCRAWLGGAERPADFDQRLESFIDGMMMLHDLRQIAEELATCAVLGVFNDAGPEVEWARQSLALHHRVVDAIVYEMQCYLPGDRELPGGFHAVRTALHHVLGTDSLGEAIHGNDMWQRHGKATISPPGEHSPPAKVPRLSSLGTLTLRVRRERGERLIGADAVAPGVHT